MSEIICLDARRSAVIMRMNKHLKLGEALLIDAQAAKTTEEKKVIVKDAEVHFKKAMNLNNYVKHLNMDIHTMLSKQKGESSEE